MITYRKSKRTEKWKNTRYDLFLEINNKCVKIMIKIKKLKCFFAL